MASPLATVFSLLDSLKRNLSAKGIAGTIERTAQDLQAFGKLQDQAAAGDKTAEKQVTDKLLEQVLNFAPAGIIGPAMAFGAKKSAVNEAAKLISEGKADEAYKLHKIYQDPTTKQLLKVIPDKDVGLNTDVMKVTNYQSMRGPATPTSLSFSAYADPVPLDTVLKHPELYKYVPELGSTAVSGKIPNVGFAGFYPNAHEAAHLPAIEDNPAYIAIGQHLNTGSEGNTVKKMLSTLLHETQHGVQDYFTLPAGGSPTNFFTSQRRFDDARRAVAALDKSKYATGYATDTLDAAAKEAFTRYQHIPGEVQARLVQRQFETGDYTTHPYKLMEAMGVDMSRLQNNTPMPPVDLDSAVQQILDVYAPNTPIAFGGRKYDK